MRRSDYDTLDRTTRIIAYGDSWLERQDNVKTIHRDGVRTPLVREAGRNWSVRLHDSECETAQAFARPRQAFWTVLREVWDEVLNGASRFVETAPAGQPPRFVKMHEVESDYVGRDLSDAATRAAVRRRILDTIEAYRRPIGRPRSPEAPPRRRTPALPWSPPRPRPPGRARCRGRRLEARPAGGGRLAAVAPEARPAGKRAPRCSRPPRPGPQGAGAPCSRPPRPGPQGAGAPLQSPPEARPAGGGRPAAVAPRGQARRGRAGEARVPAPWC